MGDNVKAIAYDFGGKEYAEKFYIFVKNNRTIDKIFILSEFLGKDRVEESRFLKMTEELVDDLIESQTLRNEVNEKYEKLIKEEEKRGFNIVVLDRKEWTLVDYHGELGHRYQVWRRIGVMEEPI